MVLVKPPPCKEDALLHRANVGATVSATQRVQSVVLTVCGGLCRMPPRQRWRG